MTQRPVVSLYSCETGKEKESGLAMPDVFSTPIRNDIVHYVHSRLAKNRRQGHAVFYKAGGEHSAESWGTGRVVARIPRISGSGTSRAGQATFGNMCRKARMFAPLKIWRKWHAKVNVTQRRHAVASALAASACTPLVMARGHHVDNVPEFPLVLDNLAAENTKTLLASLKNFGAGDDLCKVRKSKKLTTGVGKFRNSRYVMRKGPLIIYGNESAGVKQAARNLPGVDTCNVHRLNILQLAPGGHLGRFVIFTEGGFRALNRVFGTNRYASLEKGGYHVNRPTMTCADIARIINSDQVQSKLREVRTNIRAHDKTKKNALTNKAQMLKLNPWAKEKAALLAKLDTERYEKKVYALKDQRSKAGKQDKSKRSTQYHKLQADLSKSFKDAQDILDEEDRQGNYVPGETDSD